MCEEKKKCVQQKEQQKGRRERDKSELGRQKKVGRERSCRGHREGERFACWLFFFSSPLLALQALEGARDAGREEKRKLVQEKSARRMNTTQENGPRERSWEVGGGSRQQQVGGSAEKLHAFSLLCCLLAMPKSMCYAQAVQAGV